MREVKNRRRGYREWSHVLHCTEGIRMTPPPELVSPDTWTSGGIGLVIGVLLRYFIVRVLIVFKLFGRTWTLDLKDNGHKDPS